MLDALAPVGMPLDPGVEGGLRLFEHGDVAVAGGFGGLAGEVARDRVERGRNGDEHFLPVERRVGMLVIPGGAQMLQILGGGIDRRDAFDAFGRFPGQHGGRAVDGGIRQPALGGGDQAAGNFRAAALGEFADDEARVRIPRQRDRAGRKIAFAGDIEERGQQRFGGDLIGVHELGNRRELDSGLAGNLSERDGAVGGAEIDPDGVAGQMLLHFNFGRREHGEILAREFNWGSATAVARHPRCRSTPAGGFPEAGTLPTYLTSAGFPREALTVLPSIPSIDRSGAKWRIRISRVLSCTSRAAAPT